MDLLYSLYQQHAVVSTDSRNCPSGCLFFALRGERFDANAYAKSALENGAAYAVIDNPAYALDERYILVEDTFITLQELAKKHRKALGTTVIGITGTNGKTTTKELLYAVLSQKYNTHYTKGNLNNHIGVPLTLLALKAEHEIAIIEMGANHIGEIAELTSIAQPNFGLITNVGMAHLEGFGSFEGVKKTKSELYEYIKENGGKVFIRDDNNHLLEMAKDSGIDIENGTIRYGLHEELGERVAAGTVLDDTLFVEMKCETAEGAFDLKTQLVGSYNAENMIAAVAVGSFFKLTNKEIKNGLENYEPSNNRSQLQKTANNTLIVDAYNANPTSMKAAISNFSKLKLENKVLILGDMLELGEQSRDEHQRIVEQLEGSNLNEVYLVGENFASIKSKFCIFARTADLIEYLKDKKLSDSHILLKGSNGIGLTKAIEFL